ncbi:MAG: endonuclease/exonuclease/phosphatase family protein [Pelagimonas sp.]|nr:endonuclease/exonuclease/phosphatase family protein [Pelagimonas sp.]
MTIVSVTFLALVAGSFLGGVHPAGDSLAVFRRELLVLATLAVIWSAWPRGLRWPIAGLGLMALAWHAAQLLPVANRQAVPDFTLYQQNLWVNGQDYDQLLDQIAQTNPDMITLQEVSQGNEGVLEQLRTQYPSQLLCRKIHIGEAVLSRFPKVPGREFCSERDGLAGMLLETPQGPVWLVSYHVSWPWPFGQAEQLAQLLPHLETLQEPVILAGDFNAVAWSHAMSQVEKATGSLRLGPQQHSYYLKNRWPLAIDHVLAPKGYGGRTIRMPNFLQDHHGILAQLWREDR